MAAPTHDTLEKAVVVALVWILCTQMLRLLWQRATLLTSNTHRHAKRHSNRITIVPRESPYNTSTRLPDNYHQKTPHDQSYEAEIQDNIRNAKYEACLNKMKWDTCKEAFTCHEMDLPYDNDEKPGISKLGKEASPRHDKDVPHGHDEKPGMTELDRVRDQTKPPKSRLSRQGRDRHEDPTGNADGCEIVNPDAECSISIDLRECLIDWVVKDIRPVCSRDHSKICKTAEKVLTTKFLKWPDLFPMFLTWYILKMSYTNRMYQLKEGSQHVIFKTETRLLDFVSQAGMDFRIFAKAFVIFICAQSPFQLLTAARFSVLMMKRHYRVSEWKEFLQCLTDNRLLTLGLKDTSVNTCSRDHREVCVKVFTVTLRYLAVVMLLELRIETGHFGNLPMHLPFHRNQPHNFGKYASHRCSLNSEFSPSSRSIRIINFNATALQEMIARTGHKGCGLKCGRCVTKKKKVTPAYTRPSIGSEERPCKRRYLLWSSPTPIDSVYRFKKSAVLRTKSTRQTELLGILFPIPSLPKPFYSLCYMLNFTSVDIQSYTGRLFSFQSYEGNFSAVTLARKGYFLDEEQIIKCHKCFRFIDDQTVSALQLFEVPPCPCGPGENTTSLTDVERESHVASNETFSNVLSAPLLPMSRQGSIEEDFYQFQIASIYEQADQHPMGQHVHSFDVSSTEASDIANIQGAVGGSDANDCIDLQSRFAAKTKIRKHRYTAINRLSTRIRPAAEDEEQVRQENIILQMQIVCRQCTDNKRNILFLPCGHLLMCENCYIDLQTCPECNKIIRGTQKIYLS